MLCPSDGVTNCSGLLRAGSRGKSLSNCQKLFFWYATGALHHSRCVPGEMLFQDLKNTTGVSQTRIIFVLAYIACLAPSILAMPASCIGVTNMCSFFGLLERRALVKPCFRV